MKTVEINFTDDEFAALLRYCSKKYFDPATFKSISRMIILSELIMTDFLIESEVIEGAIKMYGLDVPRLEVNPDPPVVDGKVELIVPYPPEEVEILAEPPMEVPGFIAMPDRAEKKPKPAATMRASQFSLPLRERSGKVTFTYRTFKWLVNNRMEDGRFYTWLSSDVADALKLTDHQSNGALTTLSVQRAPWVVRENEDARGRIYWNFTEGAKEWLNRNRKALNDAGMFDTEEEEVTK